jgi:hypothetical protein
VFILRGADPGTNLRGSHLMGTSNVGAKYVVSLRKAYHRAYEHVGSDAVLMKLDKKSHFLIEFRCAEISKVPANVMSITMTDNQLREWACKVSSEIVKREGAALALSACDRDEPAIEADSNLLGIAIAQAVIEAYRAGEAAVSLRRS